MDNSLEVEAHSGLPAAGSLGGVFADLVRWNPAFCEWFAHRVAGEDDARSGRVTLLARSRYFMPEELRPVYLLPFARTALLEHRRLVWVLMGGGANETAWDLLATGPARELAPPGVVKLAVGGPEHGESEAPAASIASLLTLEEWRSPPPRSAAKMLVAWHAALGEPQRGMMLRALDVGRSGSMLDRVASANLSESIPVLLQVGLDASIQARSTMVDRFLGLESAFEQCGPSGLEVDTQWFDDPSLVVRELLRGVLHRFRVRTGPDWKEPLDGARFETLRQSFARSLGSHAVAMMQRGRYGWNGPALNALLAHTQHRKLLSQRTLFVDNSVCTGRTLFGLALANWAFDVAADWRFAAHAVNQFVPELRDLVHLRTLDMFEFPEDIAGLGKYMPLDNEQHQAYIRRADWIEGRRRELSSRPGNMKSVLDYGAAMRQTAESISREIPSSVRTRIAVNMLIRLYLRGGDALHPQAADVAFRHFEHVLNFDQTARLSHRGVLPLIQRVFVRLRELEQGAGGRTLRQLDTFVRGLDELRIVESWDEFASLALDQARAGWRAMVGEGTVVDAYMKGDIGFDALLDRVVPRIEPVEQATARLALCEPSDPLLSILDSDAT